MQDLLLAIGPEDLQGSYAQERAEAKVHRVQGTRGVADGAGHLVPLVADVDARSDAIAIAVRTSEFDRNPVIGIGTDIPPEFYGRFERGNNRVDFSIAIEIGIGATAMSFGFVQPGFGRDVAKPAIGEVEKHAVRFFIDG